MEPERLVRLCMLESFLRRLASAPTHLREGLVLRGSLLTRQLVWPAARAANDLDFLATWPWEPTGALVEARVRAVARIHCADGVVFHPGEFRSEVIWEENDSPGVRVHAPVSFLGRRFTVQVDVAFNDPVQPGVMWLSYQPMFGNSIELVAVHPETMFAWKLHGLFECNTVDDVGRDVQGRWRGKDVHDLYLLLRSGRVDPGQLRKAMEVAFCSRGQELQLVQRVLRKEFGSSGGSQRNWKKYREGALVPDEIPLQLHEVIGAIADFLRPLFATPDADAVAFAPRTAVPRTGRQQHDIAPLHNLDSAAMVTHLPGTADVMKNNQAVSTSEDLSHIPDLTQPGSTVRFAGRAEEFEVVKVRRQRPRQGAPALPCTLLLRQAPHFTLRKCSVQLISRRVGPPEGGVPAAEPAAGLGPLGDGADAEAVRARARRALGLSDLRPSAEEERVLAEAKTTSDQRLARRLDVLRPLAPLVYVTSSRQKFEEARRCLAEWQSMLTMAGDVKPPLTGRLAVGDLVRAMARYAFSVVGVACFLDIAYLQLEGEPRPIFALGMTEEAFVGLHRGRRGCMRSFLAFCEDGQRVEVFDGTLEGRVVDPAGEGPPHNTWDRVWLPDDYPGTLAELETSAYVVSARHLPFLELAQTLRGRDFSQIFEVHVTVEAPPGGQAEGQVQAFREACAGLRGSFGAVKPVLIENASGVAARQMMTASHHVGTLPEVHVLAFRLSQALVQLGYRVVRTKIEANMSNSGVPVSDEEAARLSPENYFEFHVKLILPPDFDEERLRGVVAANNAQLSRSAMRVTSEGVQKRFVTQRIYGRGRVWALERFERCCAELQAAGFSIEARIREYAVYDSNVRLDKGWIEAPVPAAVGGQNQGQQLPHLERGFSNTSAWEAQWRETAEHSKAPEQEGQP